MPVAPFLSILRLPRKKNLIKEISEEAGRLLFILPVPALVYIVIIRIPPPYKNTPLQDFHCRPGIGQERNSRAHMGNNCRITFVHLWVRRFKELETVTQKSGVTTFATSGKRPEFIPENIFYRLVMKNLIKLEMKTLYYHFTELNKKELP